MVGPGGLTSRRKGGQNPNMSGRESHTPKTIWLVDDDASFRELTSELALDAEIAVLSLSTDQFAAQPRLPLPDGAMLDGVVLSRQETERYLAGIPRIVICTGHNYADIAERRTQHGHVRVLPKPFGIKEFDKALRWLAGRPEEADWQAQPPLS